MYKLVYYIKKTEGLTSKEQEFKRYESDSEEFRLRRTALHYVLDIIQNEYIGEGFATETRVGGIYCYKSIRTENGDRKITEIMVKVEKA